MNATEVNFLLLQRSACMLITSCVRGSSTHVNSRSISLFNTYINVWLAKESPQKLFFYIRMLSWLAIWMWGFLLGVFPVLGYLIMIERPVQTIAWLSEIII